MRASGFSTPESDRDRNRSVGAAAMTETYTKHCIRLNPGDYRRLKQLRPDAKPNAVIRDLVSEYIKLLEKEIPNETGH
jgi:hypothetical protein